MDNPYDRIPYEGRCHMQTHPDQIASIAHLFSIPYPAIQTARILEIGCGDGSNIINIASTLPLSQCVGIDASVVQINLGKKNCAQLDLKNVELLHTSIHDVQEDLGTFDYIICHGVFSWIAQDLRERVLVLYKKLLKGL